MSALWLVARPVLFLAALVTCYNVGSSSRPLTDKSFEHDTQASTGATTGDWLVKFYKLRYENKELTATWNEVAADLDEKKREGMGVNVNLATVDIGSAEAKGLKKRFNIKHVPHIVLIRSGKVYKHNGHPSKEGLIEFATGGFAEYAKHHPDYHPQPVPPEATLLDKIMDFFTALFGKEHDDAYSKKQLEEL